MIRRATIDDLPFMLNIGAEFFSYSPWVDIGEYCRARTSNMLTSIIESEDGFAAVSEYGLICGCIANVPFAKNIRLAHEMFWWSNGNDGMKLLKAFEDWAVEKEVLGIVLSHMSARRGETIQRAFKRKGYVEHENYYIRRL